VLPAPLPELLAAYGLAGAEATRPASGLIQTTYLVRLADGARVVAQRHHPVFDPPGGGGERLLADIAAVTARLAARGLDTPRLLAREGGALGWRDGDGRLWRLMTFLDGETVDRVDAPARAAAAAALVARFHAALDGLDHAFGFTRPGAHDTEAHLRRLAAHAGGDAPGVPDAIRRLADAILAEAARRPPVPPAPPRVTHGDLKISNVLFRGDDAIALLDLDTLARLPLAVELGDALRSWCNPVGEDAEQTRFELAVFDAAVHGYARGARAAGLALAADEPAGLLPGLITIALELASRFAIDAFEDRYFGWDPARFASRREHNRVRAAGQLALARAALAHRQAAESTVASVFGRPHRSGSNPPAP
jgi:aminoglycoside phosphotransferase (APT) family kinase protein